MNPFDFRVTRLALLRELRMARALRDEASERVEALTASLERLEDDFARAETAAMVDERLIAKFGRTYCSQCGGEFGAGDAGYSHCADHAEVAA